MDFLKDGDGEMRESVSGNVRHIGAFIAIVAAIAAAVGIAATTPTSTRLHGRVSDC